MWQPHPPITQYRSLNIKESQNGFSWKNCGKPKKDWSQKPVKKLNCFKKKFGVLNKKRVLVPGPISNINLATYLEVWGQELLFK